MTKLTGKVAIVTGASKGIGAGIAKSLALAGAKVVVNYASSKEGADKVVKEIQSQGGDAIAVQASVANPDDIQRLIAETAQVFGKIDILINNAGIFKFEQLSDVTEEEFHRQFNTNVLGLILTSQAAVKQFNPNGGTIINISSLVTLATPANSVVYAATKGAVDAVTQVLAKELANKNIRVNSINPGLVDTEGFNSGGFAGGDFEREYVAKTPLGRVGKPEDIAKIAVFLASEDSGWLTGEIIFASGGLR